MAIDPIDDHAVVRPTFADCLRRPAQQVTISASRPDHREVRADLIGGPWHNRLQRVTLREAHPILAGIEIYRRDVLLTVP